MSESFLDGRVVLHAGDCADVAATLPPGSVDAIVTDPPYALVSIARRFGAEDAVGVRVPEGGSGAYARAASGFMGKAWDTGEVAFSAAFWREMFRVLKPGGHVVAFGGTRSYHRLASAIEDAGFEVRDQIGWLYGTGFPKSHNQSGAWEGWGTALKPAWEPICLARKPLIGTVAANLEAHGTGALNVDGCRVGDGGDRVTGGATGKRRDADEGYSGAWSDANQGRERPSGGRWPANVVHDGSDEVVTAFPAEAGGGGRASGPSRTGRSDATCRSHMLGTSSPAPFHGDSGSAARFFYSAKAKAEDRIGSSHPTVKPVTLMQWLVRLVCPPGGVVLDPFAGTGTTGEAAFREGMRAVLIEREPEYQADIRRRMALAAAGPVTRAAETVKAKAARRPTDAGPLFSSIDGTAA